MKILDIQYKKEEPIGLTVLHEGEEVKFVRLKEEHVYHFPLATRTELKTVHDISHLLESLKKYGLINDYNIPEIKKVTEYESMILIEVIK
jgi:hypothetical protein